MVQKKKQQVGKPQKKKQQQVGKPQKKQQKTPGSAYSMKRVVGSIFLIGLVLLIVYLIMRNKKETPTQQLEKFQAESPTPSNTTNYTHDMSKGDTFKICPNGPCFYPPNHVINIYVKNITKGGIRLDTTNVQRSEGYLPTFNVIYEQSKTFNCSRKLKINLNSGMQQNAISKDDGDYTYKVMNIFGCSVFWGLSPINSSSYNFSPGLSPIIFTSISPFGFFASFTDSPDKLIIL